MVRDHCEEKVRSLFFNYYNRANLTPLHTSMIERKLEERYPPWKISDTLKKMEGEQVLRSIEVTTDTGKIRFYFPAKIVRDYEDEKKIMLKIKRITGHINKYSSPQITDVLKRHLRALVKSELRVQGFKIIDEGQVDSYNDRQWTETRHDLDLLAIYEKKQLTVGVEVRNELDMMDRTELRIKLRLCKKLQITPVFACRWLEPYKKEITENGGFLWQFKTQMFPIGFEPLVSKMKQRFGFPVKVATEIPHRAVKEFESWIESK